MPDEISKNIVDKAFKDKFMIWGLRIILGLLALVSVIIVFKAVTGQPVDILGIKINMPDKENNSDTVSKNQVEIKGDNSHVINGNSNQVGVNGDVYNGIKQRHINDSTLYELVKKVPYKMPIIIGYNPVDIESKNWAVEIMNQLQKKGYTNCLPWGALIIDNKVHDSDLEYKTLNDTFSIIINPQKPLN